VVRYWVLVGQTPIETDIHEWAKFMEAKKNQIAADLVEEHRVSTAFLGFDHSFVIDPLLPVLFETMVFCQHVFEPEDICSWDGWQARYTNYPEAIQGHEIVTQRLQDGH
jgi:hypothetical protein